MHARWLTSEHDRDLFHIERTRPQLARLGRSVVLECVEF